MAIATEFLKEQNLLVDSPEVISAAVISDPGQARLAKEMVFEYVRRVNPKNLYYAITDEFRDSQKLMTGKALLEFINSDQKWHGQEAGKLNEDQKTLVTSIFMSVVNGNSIIPISEVNKPEHEGGEIQAELTRSASSSLAKQDLKLPEKWPIEGITFAGLAAMISEHYGDRRRYPLSDQEIALLRDETTPRAEVNVILDEHARGRDVIASNKDNSEWVKEYGDLGWNAIKLAFDEIVIGRGPSAWKNGKPTAARTIPVAQEEVSFTFGKDGELILDDEVPAKPGSGVESSQAITRATTASEEIKVEGAGTVTEGPLSQLKHSITSALGKIFGFGGKQK